MRQYLDPKSNNTPYSFYDAPLAYHTYRIIPSANHLLQTCQTGNPQEYGTIEETISPEALQLMTDWLNHILNQYY